MRLELFFKNEKDLVSLLASYRERNAVFNKAAAGVALKNKVVRLPIHAVNLPCKGDLVKDHLRSLASVIAKQFPEMKLCLHYSLNYEWYTARERDSSMPSSASSESPALRASTDRLISALWQCHEQKIPDFMIVSGSRKRTKQQFDTVAALKALAARKTDLPPLAPDQPNGISIGVAYNPYFPSKNTTAQSRRGSASVRGSRGKAAASGSVAQKDHGLLHEALEERRRLIQKLETGLVSTVWLQFGTDLERLNDELTFLTDVLKQKDNSSCRIFGSIFVPTKQWLARFRFRPWNGVFCSEDFLQDGSDQPDRARQIVAQMLSIYRKFDVEPLIESACRSDQDFKGLASLLQQAGSLTSPPIISRSGMRNKDDDLSALVDRRIAACHLDDIGASGSHRKRVSPGAGQPLQQAKRRTWKEFSSRDVGITIDLDCE
mmetsp:Transcript_33451/g.61810  ORF Transcript_33451/g.61810 Transcript_33451/m.61810 type:complete len:433 (-) Transcript_33451:130-1428(-)